MSKRISTLLFCILFVTNTLVPVNALDIHQDDQYFGYINVNIRGNRSQYQAIYYGEELYLSGEDIGEITGYSFDSGAYYSFSKSGNTDYVTYVDISIDGTAKAMGNQYRINIVSNDNKSYFPFEKMLYLLHAKWYILENCVYIEPLSYTIIDFLSVDGGFYSSMWDNMVTQADLLVNDESQISRAFKDAMAEVFNDFDPKVFVIWWPDEGWFPAVDTAYEEALLQLAVDDQAFLDSYGQTEIINYLNESSFSALGSELSSGKSVFELPSKIADGASDVDDIVNWISSNPESLKKLKFNRYGELYPPELKEWAQKLGYVTDAVEIISIFEAASEVKHRSEKWGQDFINQISILADFDPMGYDSFVVERIRTVAKNLIAEHADPITAASNRAALESTSLILSKIFDKSVFGKFFTVLNAGIAIGKSYQDNNNRFEAHDLSGTVNCLIKIENLSMNEMHRSNMKLLGMSATGNFTETDLSRLRNCTMLSLRANLRDWSFIYYLNQQLNDEANLAEGTNAQTIRSRISTDYALLCLLMETEKNDCMLILGSFDDMYSNGYGTIREPIPSDVFISGDIPVNDQEYEIHVENICGSYRIDVDMTNNHNTETVRTWFGSGLQYGDEMSLNIDGTASWYIGIGYGGEGTFNLDDGNGCIEYVDYEDRTRQSVSIAVVHESDYDWVVMTIDNYRVYWTKYNDTEVDNTEDEEVPTEAWDGTKDAEQNSSPAHRELTYRMIHEKYTAKTADGREIYYQEFEYPLFEGDGSDALNWHISRRWLKDLESAKAMPSGEEKLEEYREYYDESELTDDYLPFYDSVILEVHRVTPEGIVLKADFGMWSGGAHPYWMEDQTFTVPNYGVCEQTPEDCLQLLEELLNDAFNGEDADTTQILTVYPQSLIDSWMGKGAFSSEQEMADAIIDYFGDYRRLGYQLKVKLTIYDAQIQTNKLMEEVTGQLQSSYAIEPEEISGAVRYTIRAQLEVNGKTGPEYADTITNTFAKIGEKWYFVI